MELTVAVVLVGSLATFVFGLSKTAIPAVGSFGAALLTLVLPALPSTGVALPVLLVGDLIALSFYARHVEVKVLVRMLPAVLVGVVTGFLVVDHVDRHVAARIIGVLLIVSGLGEIARRRRAAAHGGQPPAAGHSDVGSLALGAGAGFSTMVANAGGPMMTLYLLRLGVTTTTFLGTVAWFFFALNLLKVPFSIGLGLITPQSLVISAALVPGIVIGALVGRRLVLGMSRALFENLALIATTAAGVWLLVV
ncbi:sulfite exporter TauE/SafE family protein [Actinotalea sp. M2MS4P-6]|uniref:sulfite exporter TauE/SafE family protein n=1 Tax=Actinotalea sp. M2MS4P-6 TaxID=2983762 RepID=UPI0021E476D2|nr:sulfite exporter TauE/SafE family protein [Actinotalea sp. M2MS4P-6]MCV2396016.1 sulfite exporter TauE/SafE family protein [Actinotalea sp. M2MS4P-6]